MTDTEPINDDPVSGVTPGWVEAVATIAEKLDHVGKTQLSKDGYNYRGIDSVVNALHPLLAEHKVVIVPALRSWTLDEWKGYRHNVDFNPWTRVSVIVDYKIIGPDGSWVVMTAVGEGIDNSDKGVGKAMSYAYKAFVSQLFSIPTDDPAMDNEHAHSDTVEVLGDNQRKRLVARTKKATTHPEWELYRQQLVDAHVLDPDHGRAANPVTTDLATTWDEILDSMPDVVADAVPAAAASGSRSKAPSPSDPVELADNSPGAQGDDDVQAGVDWWWALVPADEDECRAVLELQGLKTGGGIGQIRKRLADFYQGHESEFGPAATESTLLQEGS